MKYMKKKGYTRFEPEAAAESAWLDHVKEGYDMMLLTRTNVKSWFTGYNSNIQGRDKLRHQIYLGGAQNYRARLAEVAEHNYEGIRFY